MDTVGAFEAKSHLSALLERVAQGESFTITKHGKPVAMLRNVSAVYFQGRWHHSEANPGTRSAFRSNVTVCKHPARVPDNAISASANSPSPSLNVSIARNTSCAASTTSVSACNKRSTIAAISTPPIR